MTSNKITHIQGAHEQDLEVSISIVNWITIPMPGRKSKYSSVCMYLFGNNIAHMSKAGHGAIYEGLVFPYKFDLWP